MGKNDVLLFADAVHPTHNSVLAYGWIKKGQEKSLPTNSGRQRVNIDSLAMTVDRTSSINRTSTIVITHRFRIFRRRVWTSFASERSGRKNCAHD
jgi:hypothetical protein